MWYEGSDSIFSKEPDILPGRPPGMAGPPFSGWRWRGRHAGRHLHIGALANGFNLLEVPSYNQQVMKGLVFIVAVLLDYSLKCG